jgi:tetratricopeptide (TPR) repeat protein
VQAPVPHFALRHPNRRLQSLILARREYDDPRTVNITVHLRVRGALPALTLAVALIAILALTWWAYHPGLTGDFLFDDFANLPAIGATGPVDNWATFWRYITSGTADPTGRPLTLLTFLIDAHNWPADPHPFKVTNVILHLINGVLLACVLWKLGRVLAVRCVPPGGPSPPLQGEGMGGGGFKSERQETHPLPGPPLEGEGAQSLHASSPRTEGGVSSIRGNTPPPLRGRASRAFASAPPLPAEGGNRLPPSEQRGTEGDALFALDNRGIAIAALFGAGVWLLHPLLVSTTLYIVQREAMLPATFVLVALLGWMASREALARGHVKRALGGMALSAWLCTVLAVLSKANGALLPLLLLLTEWIVLSRRPMPTTETARWRQRAIGVFLILPSALVIAYLLYLLPHSLSATVEARGWSVGQRLLTEPRVLTDYLRLLFVPHAHSSGLFNDAFPISTGWLHPASTIPCIVLILALIVAGFALRKRHPAIALALLFYFAAQMMESGWIPLELYFEHRNYLPAMLLFWPIGIALTRPRTLRWVGVLVGAGILVALSALTFQRATLWGDGMRQAQVWAAINPDSARAQTNAALYDMARNRPRLAAARLRLSIPRHPDDIQAPINLIGAECRLGAVQPQTLARAEFALAHTRIGGQVAFKWFDEALAMASKRSCTGLDFAALQATLDAARRNPYWRKIYGRQQDLAHLQGQLDLAEGKPDAALASFNQALAAAPGPDSALQQAAYLGSHGYPKLGLAHLDYFATLPPGPKPGIGMPRIHAWVLRKQGWWPHEMAYLRKNLAADAATRAKSGNAHSASLAQ